MNKVLFLDRDGIINIDHGYVHSHEEFTFIDGIFDVCLHAINLNYLIIVITNQSGIARGYYTEEQFSQLTQWMKNEFEQKNITITGVFYCPHHPEKGIGKYKRVCECRKPKPGLILQAQNKFDIDITKSIFIGDKLSDMEAAEAAGITTRILVAEGSSIRKTKQTNKYQDIKAIINAIEYIK